MEAVAKASGYTASEMRAGDSSGWVWQSPYEKVAIGTLHKDVDACWREAYGNFTAHHFVANGPTADIRLYDKSNHDIVHPFCLQPIVTVGHFKPFGYEILYRGKHPADWIAVDTLMLEFLSQHAVKAPLFVNLSNEAVLTVDDQLLFRAHEINEIYFEWSEVVVDEMTFQNILARLVAWSERGLRIMVDDFGKGRDCFERMFAFKDIAGIKLDGSLVKLAMHNHFARDVLRKIVADCKSKGMITIAECIETVGHHEVSMDLGVALVQGWYVDDEIKGWKQTAPKLRMV